MDIKTFFTRIFDGSTIDIIITEIKSVKKGAMILVFLIFLICFAVDYLLLQNIFSSNLLFFIRQFYALGLIISFIIIAVKVYTTIADNIEDSKNKKQKYFEKQEKFKYSLHVIKETDPILLDILKTCQEDIIYLPGSCNNLADDLFSLGLLVRKKSIGNKSVIKVDKDFLEYVKENTI